MDRPRVLDAVKGRVTVEQPGVGTVGVDRMAIIAHYSVDGRVTKSFDRLVAGIQAAGYVVTISSACTATGPLEWPSGRAPAGVTVLRKPNVGYDFGSWAVGIAYCREVTTVGKVLLVNDSMVGPFSSLTPVINGFESSKADVWALSSNYQFGYHLQSYFMGFSGQLLSSRIMRRFWRDIRIEPTKNDVIRRYELGLSRLLRDEGYILDAEFDAARVVSAGLNPTIMGWERLLALGFPFVKRELITNPAVAPGAQRLSAVVQDMFGEDVREWT